MKKANAAAIVLACMLVATGATAAEKKDKTLIDLNAIKADNVAPNKSHTAMGSLGARVHGGEFGPWRCQVKILDRRDQIAKMKAPGKDEERPTSHFISLSVMDPATGKGIQSGKGTVTLTGPDKVVTKADLQALGGPFSADIEMAKAGEYQVQVDFASGKQKAVAKFRYTLR